MTISPKTIKLLKPLIFFICTLPLLLLILDFINGNIIDPIEDIHKHTGQWAIRFLLITLSVTPIRMLTKQNALILLRRMLGLFSFFYAFLHIMNYLILDRNIDLHEIFEDITERPYIIVGLMAFIILTILAITSPKAMIKKLGGKRWQKLHYSVYLAGIFACLHYLWLVKTINTSSVVYLLIFIVLMLYRLKIKHIRLT